MEREIYRRIGENDWVLSQMQELEVGDLFSIHEGGKFVGIFKAMGPPHTKNDGTWTVSVSRYKGE
jgi:hypothetical protein